MKESSRNRRALDHNLAESFNAPRCLSLFLYNHEDRITHFPPTRVFVERCFIYDLCWNNVPVCKYLSNVASSQRGRGNTRTRYGAKNFEMHKGGRRVRRAEKPGLVRRVKLLTRLEGNSRDEIVQSACCLSFPSSLRDCP